MYKDKSSVKKEAGQRIRKRIRKKMQGTPERPRVFVKKSNRYIYAQAIDDQNHKTIVTASSLEQEFQKNNKNTKNKHASEALGKILAHRLKEKKIKTIVFDRGTSPYHGRIKQLAEVLRKEGVIF
jgi:large subunit ribosomal protein L18